MFKKFPEEGYCHTPLSSGADMHYKRNAGQQIKQVNRSFSYSWYWTGTSLLAMEAKWRFLGVADHQMTSSLSSHSLL